MVESRRVDNSRRLRIIDEKQTRSDTPPANVQQEDNPALLITRKDGLLALKVPAGTTLW